MSIWAKLKDEKETENNDAFVLDVPENLFEPNSTLKKSSRLQLARDVLFGRLLLSKFA